MFHAEQQTTVTPAVLTEPAAARYIGMSRSFLRQSRMDGDREGRTPGPPYVKVGRAVRYLREDLDAWLWSHRLGEELL